MHMSSRFYPFTMQIRWHITHSECRSVAGFLGWIPGAGEERDWREAEVPGCAQTSAFGVDASEILLRENWLKVAWMEKVLWVYRARFHLPDLKPGRLGVLRFNGLDYRTRIFLNGRFVADHEGMFSPLEIELRREDLPAENELQLAFLPPALLGGGCDCANTAAEPVRHIKARYMEGWDFAPRLRCVGPWDDVDFEERSEFRILSAGLDTRMINRARASVAVDVLVSRPPPGGSVRVSLCGASGQVPLFGKPGARLQVAVENPKWWSPHSHGPAHLHPLTVELLDADGQRVDVLERRVGLRAVDRTAASGQKPTDTPAQYLINGVPVFLCGANLTPFSSAPAHVGIETYRAALKPLREAGVNFLRVWGGGLREKQSFYDLCDEMGFLVMQEFPLACQQLCAEPGYLELLDREARAILRCLRWHPCVIVWSGGNEHYHYWEAIESGSPRMEAIREKILRVMQIPNGDRAFRSGNDPNHPALQVLARVVAEESPWALYNTTSGLEDQGDTHGPWTYRLEIGDHRFRDLDFYQCWREGTSALYSEASVAGGAMPETAAAILGLPSKASLESLPIPADRNDPLWVAHKAFGAAWDQSEDLWLDIAGAEALFGPLGSVSDVLFALDYLQCEGTRFMVESVRRRQGRTTGIVWWGINEPFPALAGNALIDFYGRCKPALEILRASFSPHLLSLDYPHVIARKARGVIHFTNSGAAPFAGSFRADTRAGEAGEVIDAYSGNIVCRPYETLVLHHLTPLRIEEPCVTADLQLFDSDGVMISDKRYRFFREGPPHPMRHLLDLRGNPTASLFRPARRVGGNP